MIDFCLRRPDEVRTLIDGRWQEPRADMKVEWDGDTLCLTADDSRVESVGIRWNAGFEANARFFGDAWERGYGDLGWTGLIPERMHPWYMAVREGDKNSFIGVDTGCGTFVGFLADADGVTMLADTRSGSEGVHLQNRTLRLCTLRAVFNQTGDAYSFLCARVRELCDAPLLPKVPVYGGNNWYYAYGKSSRAKIMSDSQFIADMAQGLDNRPFMVIDDGWQIGADKQVCNGGPWTGNDKFGDMGELAGEMKDVGVRPGLWYRPLLTQEDVPAEWVRCESRGCHVLDSSNPNVLEYVREVTSRLSNWGFEILKHDFSTFDFMGDWGNAFHGDRIGKPCTLQDTTRTNAEHIIRLYDAIRDGAGSTMVLGCNTVSHLAAGRVEIQRTGDDTSGLCWERTRRMGINTLAMRMPQHGAFYAADADCVGLTNEIPWRLNRQWLTILAHSGTPLFVSADPDIQGDVQRNAIREAFKVASTCHDSARPIDWEYTTCPAHWHMFSGEYEFHWGDWYVPDGKSVDWR